eukprot:403333013
MQQQQFHGNLAAAESLGQDHNNDDVSQSNQFMQNDPNVIQQQMRRNSEGQMMVDQVGNHNIPTGDQQINQQNVQRQDINPAQIQNQAEQENMMQVDQQSNKMQQQIAQQMPKIKTQNLNRRLMIERVVLENFKSYYGRREIGPLHKCFTAVVGPNGSGKSNLIESLLFVFGKRAKRMRLNKLSELIHNSAEHKDVQHATVRVYFQDILDDENEPDYYEVVPGSQFEISRSVNKQSTSKYMINGQESSFKEVCELLSKKGIDLDHNRFLILQGEVEQISLMKAKAQNENETGLLEYLEDIIGSNKYVQRIGELEKEVETRDDERREKLARVNTCQLELSSLEADKDAAIDYLKKERNLMLLKNMYHFVELGDGVSQLNAKIQNIVDQKAKVRDVRDRKKKMMEENQGLVQEIQILMANEDKASQRHEALTSDFRNLEKADIMIRNEMKHTLQKTNKAKTTIDEIEHKKQKQIEENNHNEQILPKREEELKQLQHQKVEVEQEFEKLEMKVRELTEKWRKEKETLESEMNPMINQFNQIKSSIEIKKQEMAAIEGKAQKVKAEIEHNKNLRINTNKKIEITMEEIQSISQQIDQTQVDKTDLDQKFMKNMQESQEIEKELQKNKETLMQMKSSQSDQRNKGKVLQELFDAQRRGTINGVFGRLGDLGTIDQKYDCAITTACSFLDYIVVDTINNGEKAIQYLKDNHVGQGKFICMDKMAQTVRGERTAQFQCPANSLRLYDLIKPKDDKFLDAFYFGVKNTLVCENIDTASRIAYGQQRHRVVTEKGELIEKSGTMSGGGRPRTGGMSSKPVQEFSEDQIKELEQSVERSTLQVNQLKEERPQLETQKNQALKKEQILKMNFSKLQIEKKSLNEQLQAIDNKLRALGYDMDKAQEEERKVEDLKQKILEDQALLSDIFPKMEEIKVQVKEVDAKIIESGGVEYKKKKEEVESIYKRVNEVEKQINKMKQQLQNVSQYFLKFDKEIEKEKEEISRLEEIFRKLDEDVQKNTKMGELLLAELGAIESEKQQNKEKLDQRRNNFTDLKKEMAIIEEAETKAKQAVEEAIKQRTALDEFCKVIKQKIRENRDKFKSQEAEFSYIFTDGPNAVTSNALALPGQSQISQTEQRLVSSNRQSNARQTQDPQAGPNDSQVMEQSNSKRLKQEPQGFDYHLQHTPISYNYIEEEINMLTHQKQQINERIQNLTHEIQNSNPNINIIQQYKHRHQDFLEKQKRLHEVEEELSKMKEEHQILKRKRHDEFMSGFSIISTKLKEMYRLITNGGDAELEALDALDPFSEGIQFHVRPLKKSWKQMSKLSGGEKTISSLSLIFALHHYKPSPLYCMDEIDAALDYKNVAIVGDYIKKRARNSQFLIISLRNNMFELAEKLVGIYKTFDITKCVTINPNKLKQKIMQSNQQRLAITGPQRHQSNQDNEENRDPEKKQNASNINQKNGGQQQQQNGNAPLNHDNLSQQNQHLQEQQLQKQRMANASTMNQIR